MSPMTQEIVAWILVAAAGTAVLWRLVRGLLPGKGGRGCPGCGSCPSAQEASRTQHAEPVGQSAER